MTGGMRAKLSAAVSIAQLPADKAKAKTSAGSDDDSDHKAVARVAGATKHVVAAPYVDVFVVKAGSVSCKQALSGAMPAAGTLIRRPV